MISSLLCDRYAYCSDYLHVRMLDTRNTRSVYAMLWCDRGQPLCTHRAACACTIPCNAAAKVVLAIGSTLTRAPQAAPAFQDVIVVHEPASDQFFFVNFRLLEQRCAQTLGSEDREERHHDAAEPWPTFLHLREEPTLVGTEHILFSSFISHASFVRYLAYSGGSLNTIDRPTSRTLCKGQEACGSPTTDRTQNIPST